MRELKFRAWTGKYMINSGYGNWLSFAGVPYTEAGKTYDTPNIEIQLLEPIEIMQYTGLKCKNEVDIYLSDIVKHPKATEPENLGFVVIWHNNGFKLKMIGKANGEHLIIDMPEHEYLSQMEVIGNVHQNPELL